MTHVNQLMVKYDYFNYLGWLFLDIQTLFLALRADTKLSGDLFRLSLLILSSSRHLGNRSWSEIIIINLID